MNKSAFKKISVFALLTMLALVSIPNMTVNAKPQTGVLYSPMQPLFVMRPISTYPASPSGIPYPSYVPEDFYGSNAKDFVNYIKNAYNLPKDPAAGKGTTIAILDAFIDPTVIADLNTFSDYFGLPKATDGGIFDPVLTIIDLPSLYNLPPPSPDLVALWNAETNLDVQWAHAIAPGAKILLIEAGSNLNGDLLAYPINVLNAFRPIYEDTLGQPPIVAVSMSFGMSEDVFSLFGDSPINWDPLFGSPYFPNLIDPTRPSITYFAGTGDYGADPMHTNQENKIQSLSGALLFPSISPNVVAVGGTTLKLDMNNAGKVIEETAWGNWVYPTGKYSDRFFWGGGGGTSRYEPKPAYQTNYGVQYLNRTVPDVSYSADPFWGFIQYNGFALPAIGLPAGWIMNGGTSAGTPQWAAIQAISQSQHLPSLNSNEFYQLAKTDYSKYFNDITKGSNGYPALGGYDRATGLGSPRNILGIPATP